MNSENDLAFVRSKFDPTSIEWQGHRGCRGLMPENSLDGFLDALKYPVQTLEMDVVLSADDVVIVSHEPWFSEEICHCDSLQVNNLFKMTYDEIKMIECGTKHHPRFPKQKKLKSFKPSLIDVVSEVKNYCNQNQVPLPKFNIELKSKPEWDLVFLPDTRHFVDRVYETIRLLGIEEMVTIQSFDARVLNAFQAMNTKLTFAFLTDLDADPLEQMQVLNKLPNIYSPDFKTLTPAKVKNLQNMNIRVIPWTVNDVESMQKLIDMGVDGIITDYPNLIQELD